VEDANRVIKQEFALERIRVADWLRGRRLVLLVGIAYGFVGLVVAGLLKRSSFGFR
jgi:hypothetical protein